MSLGKKLSHFRVTVANMYCLFLLMILSIGIKGIQPTNRLSLFIYRLFVYNDMFTYCLSGYLMYSMKVLEVIYGSYSYMSLLFTTTLLTLVCKGLLSLFLYPAYGVIMSLSSLYLICWITIPAIKQSSLPIYKSIKVSSKIVHALLVLLLSLSCGFSGLIECINGLMIGLVITRRLQQHRSIIPFPTVFTTIILKFVGIVFEEDSRLRSNSIDSSTPLHAGVDMSANHQVQVQVVEEEVDQLMNLGFSRYQCVSALQACDHDVNRAAEKLLSLYLVC